MPTLPITALAHSYVHSFIHSSILVLNKFLWITLVSYLNYIESYTQEMQSKESASSKRGMN